LSYLGQMPPFGRLGDGVGHLGACGPEQHDLVWTDVHHVEESLHSHSCITLQKVNSDLTSVRPDAKTHFWKHTPTFQHSIPRLKIRGSIPPLPTTSSWCRAQLIVTSS
jgi:hypothetical protein